MTFQTPTLLPIPRNSKWILSVDVGQSIDPTAISVLEVVTRRQAVRAFYDLSEEARNAPGVIVPPIEWYDTREGGTGGVKFPTAMARVDVRRLQRLPLRIPYPEQVGYISSLLRRQPLASPRAELVLDMTGVGRPVVDMFRHAGLNPVGVTITGGDKESRTPEGDWRVSKLQLVSRLQALLHSGMLRIAQELPEARTLAVEMQDFRANISESGYTRFGAREGQHDDLVLSVAIGSWLASNMFARETITTTYMM